MSSAEPQPRNPSFASCARCDEVIGVYEPPVKIAAEDGLLYHDHCYDSISGSEA